MNQQLQEAAKAYAIENGKNVGRMSWHTKTPEGAIYESFLAGAAHMQAQSAGVWVKASERLPQMERPIVARLEGCTLRTGNFFEDRGECKFFVNHRVGFLISSDKFCNIEWLDGSPTTGGESEAVAFAEWLNKNYDTNGFIGFWSNTLKESYTTAELYAIYKKSLI